MKSKMNLKLDLSMVNTILMVVVLILVIVACVRRYRENFTSNYFIQPVCDDEKYKDNLHCVNRGSQGASAGEGNNFDFIELSEITSGEKLMNWAQSDDGVLSQYTIVPTDPIGLIGKYKIDEQIKLMSLYLINIFTRVLKSFDVAQDADMMQSVNIIKKNASIYLEENNNRWSPKNIDNFNIYIKANGNFDTNKKDKIMLLKADSLPQGLIDMHEVDENDKPDNNLRELKNKKYKLLLEGGDNTDSDENYVINDTDGNAINFNKLLGEIINEKELEINWVTTLTSTIIIKKHLKLALQTIMTDAEIETLYP